MIRLLHEQHALSDRFITYMLARNIVHDDGQEGMIDLEATVVFDEPELLELVHEEIDARTGRADHFRERLLRDPRQDALLLIGLAVTRQQQQRAGEALLAGIEQLVDEVFFDAALVAFRVVRRAGSGHGASGHICNRGDQFGRFERLGEVRLEPCREGSMPIVRACVAGQRDRRKKTAVCRLMVADPLDERALRLRPGGRCR